MISWQRWSPFTALVAACLFLAPQGMPAEESRPTTITVTIDRGRDVGQGFGTLFDAATDDGSLVIGAGFQNLYNTNLRADRHVVSLFVRPTDGKRTESIANLPRPNKLCGTYLHSRDGTLYSLDGGVRKWHPEKKAWEADEAVRGETMRVGHDVLAFTDGKVLVNGKVVLAAPDKGSYQRFFYANGHLCFYHVNRGEGGYRPYKNDVDGFSRLHACPWTAGSGKVDLGKSVVLRLPIVGETTFAWGQFGKQIVTGSNIGGFYVFDGGKWKTLREPDTRVSYQIYSTLEFHDRLLMGQYPSGRLFEYDGQKITDRKGWPPVLKGVSHSAREAQTTTIYAGELFVGVWPWGELWRYNPDSKKWAFVRRVFDHPEVSDKIVHPYDVESKGAEVPNRWGQRVTSLIPIGTDLFLSTSAKDPCEWDAKKYPFLAPDKWRAYGAVHRLSMPGHLSAASGWTDGPTTFEFTLRGSTLSIAQDRKQLAAVTLTGPLAEHLRAVKRLDNVKWGEGTFGRFGGTTLKGQVQP